MRVGILGSPRGWHVQALRRALECRGIAVACLPITRLVARIADRPWVRSQQEPLDDYDALFVRAIPGGSLEQIIFRVDALHRLENAGVRIVNPPTTIERTVDKYYTSWLLAQAGLPTPRTVVAGLPVVVVVQALVVTTRKEFPRGRRLIVPIVIAVIVSSGDVIHVHEDRLDRRLHRRIATIIILPSGHRKQIGRTLQQISTPQR